jgi:hypothetical protein
LVYHGWEFDLHYRSLHNPGEAQTEEENLLERFRERHQGRNPALNDDET